MATRVFEEIKFFQVILSLYHTTKFETFLNLKVFADDSFNVA